jgi:hypothetical protein
MRVLPLVLLLCASGWVAACGGDDDADNDAGVSSSGGQKPARANAGDALEPGTRTLEITSSAPIRAGLGARIKLSGRLLDADEEPVVAATVSFALIGRMQDSSISALDSVTGDDGVFENELIAGEIATAFRLRVVSAGAIDLFADVVVSDAGFGTLLVTASYEGTRMVKQSSVFAQADTSCSDVQRMPDDPQAALSANETLARLSALPAGVRYAVTAVAENDSGKVLARGCVDGVAIQADTVTKTEIEFTDEPLMRAGVFAFSAEFGSKAPASALAVALLGSVDSLIVGDESSGGAVENPEASFLLDTLAATLRSDDGQPEWPALADAVANDRATKPSKETPEHQLQGLLEINGHGPLLASTRMAALVQTDLEHLRLSGELTLTRSGNPAATFLPTRIEAVATQAGQKPIAIDLARDRIKAATKARFLGAEDALQVSSMSFSPQLGALSSQVLRAVMSVDAPGHGDEVRELLGCASLEEWLNDQSYSAGASCDTDCIAEVCERAVARLLSAAESGLLQLDEARPSWTLSGTFALIDQNGDLFSEQMTCDAFSAEWDAAADSSNVQPAMLTGTASASLISL